MSFTGMKVIGPVHVNKLPNACRFCEYQIYDEFRNGDVEEVLEGLDPDLRDRIKFTPFYQCIFTGKDVSFCKNKRDDACLLELTDDPPEHDICGECGITLISDNIYQVEGTRLCKFCFNKEVAFRKGQIGSPRRYKPKFVNKKENFK